MKSYSKKTEGYRFGLAPLQGGRGKVNVRMKGGYSNENVEGRGLVS